MAIRTFLVLVFFLVGISCDQANKKETASRVAGPVRDNGLAVSVADKFFIDSIFGKGLSAMPIEDPQTQKRWFLRVAGYDSLNYPLQEDVTVVGVLMKDADSKDSLIIDYRLQWELPTNPTDTSSGAFRVIKLEIRKVNDSLRYRWERKGAFYGKTIFELQ